MSAANVGRRPPNFQDLTGQRFGLLTVVRWAGRDSTKRAVWECVCECSGTTVVKAWNLKNGHVRSCGCAKKKWIGDATSTHGYTRGGKSNRAYKAWAHMRTRCTNKNSPDYPDYGGRGIKVCERWQSFENFYADMGDPPPGMSIDRYPDVNGDYEPGNCRWATQAEQNLNRRNTVTLTYNGRTQPLYHWAAEVGLPPKMLYQRYRAGWSHERIITERPNPKRVAAGRKL